MVLHDVEGRRAGQLQEQRPDQFGAVRHAELAVHAHQVGLDRRLSEREIACDLLVRAAVAHEACDLLLAIGQTLFAANPVNAAPRAQQRAQRSFDDWLKPRKRIDFAGREPTSFEKAMKDYAVKRAALEQAEDEWLALEMLREEVEG